MAPKIAILGAGPSGLTLASLLNLNHIPYKLYDLRPRPASSSINQPSGSLDLHQESGLLALKACGLYEEFEKLLNADCSEDMKLADKTGTVLYQDQGDGNRPEISRNALSNLLLGSVPDENITWEKKVLSVEAADGRKWRVNFASNSPSSESEVFDLVVGADGAWSRVRHLLTDVKPYASGVNCITLTIPQLTTTYPQLAAMVGTGGYAACGQFKAVMSQRGSMGCARLYLMISSPASAPKETWLRDSGLEKMNVQELKVELLKKGGIYGDWAEQVKELVAVGCDAESVSLGEGGKVDMRPLHMLPPGHTWTHVPGLTLVGDAAHLMTPFAGEGVNMAMLDALQLGQLILKAYPEGDLDEAVTKYEEGMWPRAKEEMEGTEQNMHMIFAEDSPRAFVEFFKSHGPPPAE